MSTLIWSLSLPAILSMLVSSLNMLVDRTFVSWGVGTTGVSAVSVSTGLTLIVQGFSFLPALGGAATIGLKLGKGDTAGAQKVIGNAVGLSVLISIVLTVVALLVLKPLLTLYGANDQNLEMASQYATVITAGTILFMLAQVSNNLIKGMGYAKRALFNFALSIVVNAALNPVFIFVFKWGVIGSAASTVIGYAVAAGLSLQFLRSPASTARFTLAATKLTPDTVRMILRIGLPACVTQLALSLVSLTFNHVAYTIGGNSAVAAYGLIYGVIMMVYMPIIGLGQGIQPIVSHNYGAGDYDRARLALRKSLLWSTLFCLVAWAIIELFAGPVAALLTGGADPALTSLTAGGLRLFCASLPLVGFVLIVSSFYQYIGQYKQATMLTALRQLIFLIPLVMVLAHVWGAVGLWIATPIADVLAFFATLIVLKCCPIAAPASAVALDDQAAGLTGSKL
jgi:putative MATE family efflux protein